MQQKKKQNLEAILEERVFVSDQTFADILETSRTSIWRFVKQGILPPPIKIGGISRFDLKLGLDSIRRQQPEFGSDAGATDEGSV